MAGRTESSSEVDDSIPADLERFVHPDARLGTPADDQIPFVVDVGAGRLPSADELALAVSCGAALRLWDLGHSSTDGSSLAWLEDVIQDV